MMSKDIRAAAERYIAEGCRVIPLYGVEQGGCACHSNECKPRDWGKHEPPLFDGAWKNGHVFVPSDFNEGDNIAIAMGPYKPGTWLVALDFDGTRDVEKVLGATLPETLAQTTPRGMHLVYTVPEFTPLGNYVDVFRSKHIGWSMDLRYARGRIVVAPSKGATGDYRWSNWRTPTPLPEYVIEDVLEMRRKNGLPVEPIWTRGGKAP